MAPASIEEVLHARREDITLLARDYEEKPILDTVQRGFSESITEYLAPSVETTLSSHPQPYTLFYPRPLVKLQEALFQGACVGVASSFVHSSFFQPMYFLGAYAGWREASRDEQNKKLDRFTITIDRAHTAPVAQALFLSQYAEILWAQDAPTRRSSPFVIGFGLIAAHDASYQLKDNLFVSRQRVLRNVLGSCIVDACLFLDEQKDPSSSALATTYLLLESAQGGTNYLKTMFKTIPQIPIFAST